MPTKCLKRNPPDHIDTGSPRFSIGKCANNAHAGQRDGYIQPCGGALQDEQKDLFAPANQAVILAPLPLQNRCNLDNSVITGGRVTLDDNGFHLIKSKQSSITHKWCFLFTLTGYCSGASNKYPACIVGEGMTISKFRACRLGEFAKPNRFSLRLGSMNSGISGSCAAGDTYIVFGWEQCPY